MKTAFQKRFLKYLLILSAISFLNSSCGPSKPRLESYRKQSRESSSVKNTRDQIIQFARQQIGCKYKLAGKCISGFDCSGFVIYVYHEFRIPMATSANEQAKQGIEIQLSEADAGDLIFFGSGKVISHVGIISGNKNKNLSVIHSTSSLGVIEENILKSDYWMKRIKKVVSLNSYVKSNEISFQN